ncbi:YgiT-type zinc finger protein [Desulfatirhabdium butyrativorans]|uniref:YgiT-type zinc finger protein n=1 Tax=Desulfatirhabdium butyrativorans TaxID=340467 RepID=UPI00041D1FD8|nr:YgiT-type zinc finger protein [Desulfatirhabdium butyrativorans]
MKCVECGGEMMDVIGTVKMTCRDGSLILFKGIPMKQCRQCGEQYLSGQWSETIGEMMRRREELAYDEILRVPVVHIDGSLHLSGVVG